MEISGLAVKSNKNNTLKIDPETSFKNSAIIVEGEGNCIIIERCRTIQNLSVHFKGNYKTLYIHKSNKKIRGLKIVSNRANEQSIEIGEEFGCGGVEIQANDGLENISIGKDCLFSWGIRIRSSDGHSILGLDTKLVMNLPADVKIGDHVWVSENVSVLKGASVGSNSIIAHSSVVTSPFEEENVIVGGTPAKILKRLVSWDRENPVIYDKQYLNIPETFKYKGKKLSKELFPDGWAFQSFTRLGEYFVMLFDGPKKEPLWWLFDNDKEYLSDSIESESVPIDTLSYDVLSEIFISKKSNSFLCDYFALFKPDYVKKLTILPINESLIDYIDLCSLLYLKMKKINGIVWSFLKSFYVNSFLQVFLVRRKNNFVLIFVEWEKNIPRITIQYEFAKRYFISNSNNPDTLIVEFFKHIHLNFKKIHGYLNVVSRLSLVVPFDYPGDRCLNFLPNIEKGDIESVFVEFDNKYDSLILEHKNTHDQDFDSRYKFNLDILKVIPY